MCVHVFEKESIHKCIQVRVCVYLGGGYHGAESKDGGTVFNCRLVIKRPLSVQQQNGYLYREQTLDI